MNTRSRARTARVVRGLLATAALAGVLVSASAVHVRNRIAESEELVHAAWSQVRNVEQRRADLIPQLVRVTEAYAAHERTVIDDLLGARQQYLAGSELPAGAEHLGRLDSSLTAVLAIAEQHPELHSVNLYRRLEFELRGSHNRIVTERMRYNERAAEHRALMRSVPYRFFAGVSTPDAPLGAIREAQAP